MKSFAEFYRQVSKQRLLKEDMGLTAPAVGSPSGLAPATNAPAMTGAGGMMQMPATGINFGKFSQGQDPASMMGKVEDEEFQKFSAALTEMMSDNTDLGNFVSQLKNYIGKPEFISALTKTGPEDKLAVTKANIPVNQLIPTQDQIFLENSLYAGCTNKYGNLAKILSGTSPDAAGSVVVAQVGGDSYHIIDGHHRWSQFVCFNPKQEIACKVVTGLKSALEGLKVTHLAVAAELKKVPKAGGDENNNMLKLSEETIAAYATESIKKAGTLPIFQQNTPQDAFAQVKPDVPVEQATEDDFGGFIGSNSNVVKSLAGKSQTKNNRHIMPQTDNTKFDNTLGQGQVNTRSEPVQFMAAPMQQNSSTFHPGLSMNEQLLVLSGVLSLEQAENNLKKRKRR